MKNKGVSGVVVAVLLILLVVVGVAIIGLITSNLSDKSGEAIQSIFSCKDIEVSPVKCTYNDTSTYVLFRTKINGEAQLTTIILVIEKMDSSSVLQNINGKDVSNLETNSYLFNTKDGALPSRFSVASSFRKNNGQVNICPYPVKLSCVSDSSDFLIAGGGETTFLENGSKNWGYGGGGGGGGGLPPTNNPPSATLISPSNGHISLASFVSFNASFTDDNGLVNATLYLWNSTGSLINNTETKILSGTSGSTNISIELPYQDTFHWNYLVYDSNGASSFALNNFSLIFEQGVNSCQDLDIQNKIYYLASDVNPLSDSTCFNIIAENVTLDCQSHKITNYVLGIPTVLNNVYAIKSDQKDFTKVTKCIIELDNGFGNYGMILSNENNASISKNIINVTGEGILALDVRDSKIFDNVFNKGWTGVELQSNSDRNKVWGNRMIGQSDFGIRMDFNSDNNNISNNQLEDMPVGIEIRWGNENEISHNNLSDIHDLGVYDNGFVPKNMNTKIINNSIKGDCENGILLDRTTFALIYGNEVNCSGTLGTGIALNAPSSYCNISRNILNGNSIDGIRISGSGINYLGNNIISKNGERGLVIFSVFGGYRAFDNVIESNVGAENSVADCEVVDPLPAPEINYFINNNFPVNIGCV